MKVFDYLTLFVCPYCKEGEGQILVDLACCNYARREDPDPRHLERGRLEDGQDLLRTGRRPTRWQPCRHLLRVEGKVRWDFRRDRDRRAEDDRVGGRKIETWRIEFFWLSEKMDSGDLTHAGVLRDLDKLQYKKPELLPSTPYRRVQRVHVLDDDDEFRIHENLDEIELAVLVAKKPQLFLEQLSAKAYEYNALLQAKKHKKKSS